ncbi:MAG: CDP-diacylglycerol--glycerol-3-phosphate 3-phosphatidyltransferase [Dictyoglomus sp.]|nr:CDP-diacylglycerol--glycerol-3-phosphate 3-phosphatidyltransferase [Dictyoglomus sp.]MCX7942529.1 CDP-diacylglycerol--glycerol-3-phosphate 3-phosphatidyltransferase [Dictyoglomaceae bacterium]MDW8188767.1 CDP-diacylglycerol--glycerol-3-phosphate 3-phosphatidyltransferase [Dictyoglomus sp.]
MGKKGLIPNYLTILRIFLTIPVIILSLFDSFYIFTGILFFIAIFTDYLDGKFARKYNQVSNLGKFLDPLADKILVLSILIVLVEKKEIPFFIPIIILIREFAITGLRSILAQKGIVLSALKEGKIKTFLQDMSILFYIFKFPGKELLLFSAIFFTIYSGIIYFLKYWKILSESEI